jgi:hypothetical protein
VTSSYEIRITGILPPEALLDYEDLTASVKPVETVVHGQLPDQAALHGLLARLEVLGVQVLEIRRLHDQARLAQPAYPARPTPGPGDDEPGTDSGIPDTTPHG